MLDQAEKNISNSLFNDSISEQHINASLTVQSQCLHALTKHSVIETVISRTEELA